MAETVEPTAENLLRLPRKYPMGEIEERRRHLRITSNRQAEISQATITVQLDENVRAFDITMGHLRLTGI